ncbi:hypothetical protein [Vibrio maerlii]|uniref:hypothetical protein n=1 Tax=Vibrio maerlii TaxID=2231648 RepID=UPI000E3D7308|nr:hypothetical protein [Vibrio maerlii]
MKTMNKVVLATAISQILTVSAYAAVPNTFSSGTAAKASEVNANFTYLDDKATSLDTTVTRIDGEVGTLYDDVGGLYDDVDDLRTRVETLEDQGGGNDGGASNPYTTVGIDCDTDGVSALYDALENARNASTRTTFNLSGTCNGAYIDRGDIKIVGDGTAIINAISVEDPESFFIDAQSNVRLENITLVSGIAARNSSSVRLDDVTFSNLPPLDGDEYAPNIDLNTAYLRINSGSIGNVAIHAKRNSTVDIKDGVDGDGLYIRGDVNSSLLVDSTLVSFDRVEAIGNTFIYVNALNADEVIAEQGSVIEADSLDATDLVEAWGNSRIAVWGSVNIGTNGELNITNTSSFTAEGALTTGTLNCENSSTFQVGEDLTTTSTFDWDLGVSGLAIQKGCHGQYGMNVDGSGSLTTAGSVGYGIYQYSTLIDGNYNEILNPQID